MSATYKIHEARRQLSRLAERAAQGEVIVIARNGRPVARLGPLDEARTARQFGLWKGKVWTSPNFEDPVPPDVQGLFERRSG